MRESGAIVGRRVLGPEINDSDATITGFVLQQHLPALLDFLTNKTPTIRFAALHLIGTLLRQGSVFLLLFFTFLLILFLFLCMFMFMFLSSSLL